MEAVNTRRQGSLSHLGLLIIEARRKMESGMTPRFLA